MIHNSVVQLASKFVDVGLMGQIDRWYNKTKALKAVSCPKIVSMYNGNMGGVDLADMLISLYRMEVKTRRCYIKVFWHMVDNANVDKFMASIPKDCKLLGLPLNKQNPLAEFTIEITQSLIHAHQTQANKSNKGRPKRKSTDPLHKTGEKAAIPPTNQEIRFNKVGHSPQPKIEKKRPEIFKITAHWHAQNAIFTCI